MFSILFDVVEPSVGILRALDAWVAYWFVLVLLNWLKFIQKPPFPTRKYLFWMLFWEGQKGEKKKGTWKLKNLSKETCDVKMDFIKSIYYLYH